MESTKLASLTLKQKSVVGLNMPQTIHRGMDKLQTHANPTFQPFGLKDDGYLSSDPSSISSKKSLSSHAKAEFSNIVIMLVMVTEVANFEEQLASMKATLDQLSKESAKKNAQIKRQNEQIAVLTKKLEKKSYEASNRDSGDEDSDKESNHNEESDNKRMLNKDSLLGSMSAEQIQSLIANAVKA